MAAYPNEFLGRCATCLGNAMLSSTPCRIGLGQGMPLNDDQCLIRTARKDYDQERAEFDAAWAEGTAHRR